MTLKSSLALLALVATSFTSQAASTGTITFNGELTDSTCDVSIDGQGADASVTLPTVSINQLAAPGKTSGRTSFNMNLSKCVIVEDGSKHAKVAAFFQPGNTVDLSTGRLKNTSSTGASLVDLQLLDASGNYKPINVGNSEQVSSTTYVDIDPDSGTAFLPYAVEYYANGQTTPGIVTSSVVYNLQYK